MALRVGNFPQPNAIPLVADYCLLDTDYSLVLHYCGCSFSGVVAKW